MTTLQSPREFVTIEPREKALWYAVRQALIIILGAIEDYLCIERSIVPRHKRNRETEKRVQSE